VVAAAHDRLYIDFKGFGTRLRAEAKRQQMSIAALVRQAIVRVLDEDQTPGESDIDTEPSESSHDNVQLHLWLSRQCLTSLTTRARAVGTSRSALARSLLSGTSPPPLPADHDLAVRALLASTDRLAVLSTDLAEFLRLLGKVSRPELATYSASIRSLHTDVREHLKAASALLAELRPYRRPR